MWPWTQSAASLAAGFEALAALTDPALGLARRHHLLVLVDTARRLHEWALANPDRERVSRVIGKHRYAVEGVEEERMITPFSLWMFQRPLDVFPSLEGDEKATAEAFLEGLGGRNCFHWRPT